MPARLILLAGAGSLCLFSVPQALRAQPTGFPASQLVWPWERSALLRESLPGRSAGGGSWPKSLSEICAALRDSAAGSDPAARMLAAECRSRGSAPTAAFTAGAAAHPVARRYPLGKAFEEFGGSWRSVKVEAEGAGAWLDLPPAAQLELSRAVSPHTFAYFRLAMRRDLRAWHEDPLGGNLPLSDREVDLNEPSRGYFHAESESFAFTLGRLPVHWSPSTEFGLALSRATPFHDAAQVVLKFPALRYRYLVSSLNPWLEGTPSPNSSGEGYPPGSEEYRQRHYPDQVSVNAHRRVYDARLKTLVAHRLEGGWRAASFGITELAVVGGKLPDLQDVNPFSFFHNNFKEGYINKALSLDARAVLPRGFAIGAEAYLDDLVYRGTETGETSRSLIGWLLVLEHSIPVRGALVRQSLHAVRTDPLMYDYYQPLNTAYSRRIYSTNMQRQGDRDFVDKYVVDHPLGYARGGDAADAWYGADILAARWSARLRAGLLAKGSAGITTPAWPTSQDPGSAPSGAVEREVRLSISARAALGRGLEAAGGAAWQGLAGSGHRPGSRASRAQASLGLEWALPPR